MCLAIPGRIMSIRMDSAVASASAFTNEDALDQSISGSHHEQLFRTARVDFGGVVKEVSLACVPEATIGEYVLVHAGLALTVLDESAARQLLAELGETSS